MKNWCAENGGHYRAGKIEDDFKGLKSGFIFSFFDEESAMAFCLTFNIDPKQITQGIKR
jgi:hypothetical protein